MDTAYTNTAYMKTDFMITASTKQLHMKPSYMKKP